MPGQQGEGYEMQAARRGLAPVVALWLWTMAASTAAAQYYPPTYPTDPYSPYYGQYYGYSAYGSPYQSYYPYGYTTPYAYQGYGTPYPYPGVGYTYQPPGPYGYAQYSYQYPYGTYPPYGYPAPYPGTAPLYPGAGAFTVTATLSGANMVTLSWTPVPGATSYSVFQSFNGGPMSLATTTANTTTTLPTSYGSYSFQVRAIGPTGAEIGVSNTTAPLGTGGGYYGSPTPYYPTSYPPAPYPPYPGVPSIASPATSFLFLSPNPAPITQTAQLTVTVLDANRFPVVGRTVSVMSSRGPIDSITPTTGSAQTDSNGRVQFNVRGAYPGPATLTATVDGVALPPLQVNFIP
jgi:hypothetical protein